MRFLTERGFDAAAAEQFGCGYAPSGWDNLTKHLLGLGYTLDELVKAAVSKEGRHGPIDRFHRRLLWPIRDLGGDVVGFGARRLFDDDGIDAKYLNTSETPVYRKTHVLFGLDQAKREIAKSRQVVVVEGYTDVMAMHLAGVKTAVATCGTAFGSEHVSVIRRLIGDDSFDRGEVIYTFDGDAAGQAAAKKAFEGEQNFATQTYIAVAADGQDPCDLRNNRGDAAVKDLVARRDPLYDFYIRAELDTHKLDTAEGRVAALQRTVPIVARIKREDLRDEYARRLAGWVGWEDIPMVVRRVRETAGAPADGSARPRRREAPPGPRREDPQLHLQRQALKAALQIPAVAGPGFDELPDAAFTHPAFVAVHHAIVAAGGVCAAAEAHAWLEAVIEETTTDEIRGLISELAVEDLELPRRNTDEARYVARRARRGADGAGRAAGHRDQVAAAADELDDRPGDLQRAVRRPRAARAVPDRAARAGRRSRAVSLLDRLLRREPDPSEIASRLEGDERVLRGRDAQPGAAPGRHVVGIWPPGDSSGGSAGTRSQGDVGGRGARREATEVRRPGHRAARRRPAPAAPARRARQGPADRARARHRVHPLAQPP